MNFAKIIVVVAKTENMLQKRNSFKFQLIWFVVYAFTKSTIQEFFNNVIFVHQTV